MVIKELSKYLPGVEVMVSTGGTQLKEDIYRLYNKVHVLVGTPGRILDLASRGIAKLGNIHTLVLDEVDKLLSVDFRPIVEKLMKKISVDCSIQLFSATYPVTLKDFQKENVPEPFFINLMDELTLKGVTQFYAYLDEKQKLHCLNTLFSKL
jgi:ATP-dependent RNA helicase DDX6/DHH1